MLNRSRRLRSSALLRGMVRETRMSPDALIYPLFLQEGSDICQPIPSLPGQFHYSPDRVAARCGTGAGRQACNKFLLFGLPCHKDACGSDACNDQGIVQQGLLRHPARPLASKSIWSPMCACASTPTTATAAFSTARRWTTTRPWRCSGQDRRCPTPRRGPTWWPLRT